VSRPQPHGDDERDRGPRGVLTDAPPQLSPRRRWIAFAALMLGLFTLLSASTSVNTALPVLQHDLGAGMSQVEWLVDSYFIVFTVFLTPAGRLGDLFGRKRMYLIGAVTMGVFGFVYFAMLNTLVPGWIFLAIVLSFIPHDMMYGPQGALIAECFSPRLRYSGSSLGYHLSSVIAGGPAPLIATALLASTGSGYSVAIYVLMCSIVSVSATALLPDYTNRDISQEHIYGAQPVPVTPAAAGPARAD